MTPKEREILIERVVSAWRPRGRDLAASTHPAWHDLDDAARREAFEAARVSRLLEAALDPEGLSSTARAVLATIGANE
jgi:hypothetical protein